MNIAIVRVIMLLMRIMFFFFRVQMKIHLPEAAIAYFFTFNHVRLLRLNEWTRRGVAYTLQIFSGQSESKAGSNIPRRNALSEGPTLDTDKYVRCCG